MSRACFDCAKPVTRSSTGYCCKCAAKRRWQDPAKVAAFRVSAKAGAAKRVANPVEMDRLRAAMVTVRAGQTAESARLAAISRDRTRMGWCPRPYRDLNTLLRKQGVLLAERKTLIADQIAADERARLAALSPFERQLERIAAGAKLIEVQPLRRTEPSMTLGGVPSSLF